MRLTGNRQRLKSAIDRSRSHNEIVALEFEGQLFDLQLELHRTEDGYVDLFEVVEENDGTIDAWSVAVEDGWRINVTLTQQEDE
jgi:hypothetical protein